MSERIELIMTDTVGKVGKATCTLRIPADTARAMSIAPGTPYKCYKDGNKLVYVFPEGQAPEAPPALSGPVEEF